MKKQLGEGKPLQQVNLLAYKLDHKVKKEYLINALVIIVLVAYSVVVSFSYGKNFIDSSKF